MPSPSYAASLVLAAVLLAGCTGDEEPVREGRNDVQILSVDRAGRFIDVDVLSVLHSDAGGRSIRNESPKLRALPVADDVELPRRVGPNAMHFRITVKDGVVTAIREVYTP